MVKQIDEIIRSKIYYIVTGMSADSVQTFFRISTPCKTTAFKQLKFHYTFIPLQYMSGPFISLFTVSSMTEAEISVQEENRALKDLLSQTRADRDQLLVKQAALTDRVGSKLTRFGAPERDKFCLSKTLKSSAVSEREQAVDKVDVSQS